MTLRTKRWIDYWLGGFLLALLFVPARLLGFILQRDHSVRERRGCVVIKLVGAGSLFMAMPAMREVRDRFPAGAFYLVGTKSVTGVAKDFGWFDECWTIDDSSAGRMIVSTLRVLWLMAWRADHLIDLEIHSRLTTVLGILSTVRNRIGFVDEIVFWRRGFYTHMTFFNMHGPVYVFYDMITKWFGIESVPVNAFNASFRARVLTEPLPAAIVPPTPYVAIGPGCSDLAKERQLRPDEWRRLLAPLVLAGADFLLLGGPADAPLADAIIAELGRGENLCGRLTVAGSAKVIALAASYHGIDSMLLHLARALGTPTVSVFGPTSPDILLRPTAARERVAFSRLPCSPCIHVHETPPCQGQRTCMALALDDLVAGITPSPSFASARGAAVGWEVEPGVSKVKEVSVHYA